MKFYKNLIVAFFLIGCTNLLFSEEVPIIKHLPQDARQAKEIDLKDYDWQKIFAKPVDRLQETSFTVFDSLANSLSYCGSSAATPFVFDPINNYLVTIKRGSKEVTDAGWTKLNSKNNLFLRISKDNGYTWEPRILVYDEIESQIGSGRYPTCSTFLYDDVFAVAFSGSLVNEASGSWLGQVTGLWSAEGDINSLGSQKCVANGAVYDWGISDAVVHGYTNGSGQLVIIAANGITPLSKDLSDYGNFGLRKIVEMESVETSIPDAWKSSFFYPVTDTSSRPNEIIGLRPLNSNPNSPLYLGVLGNFKVTPDVQKAKFGFSISTDNGDTWQPYVIMPASIIQDYTESLGIERDSAGILYDAEGFTVLSNGDVYFIGHFREFNSYKAFYELINQLVEVKYTASSQSWSISKIADCTGLYVNVVDENLNPFANPTYNELQLAKTVDESKLFLKWVDLVDVNWVTDSTYQFGTSDVFYSVKDLTQGTGWQTPRNLTESDEYDRQTHIAPIVPNNLVDIPILKIQTIFDPANNEVPGTSEYILAMRQYLRKQEVQIAHFNAILGVDDYPIAQSETNLNRVYPNPAQNSASLDYSIKGVANIDISIYDLLGKKLQNVFSGVQSEGVYSYNIDTKDLQSGTYYITLKSGNKSTTKMLSIIK
ncbi:MAG TPA: T9SS type A sorting domain-containing protein [Candidatus Kapabacteria bacterium]|jgi:hypothetical protein|nr:T9SS type A sorting domain-containing protein [Candidatus Kapabacteria bacterium]